MLVTRLMASFTLERRITPSAQSALRAVRCCALFLGVRHFGTSPFETLILWLAPCNARARREWRLGVERKPQNEQQMRKCRVTGEMYAAIPGLIAQGLTHFEIAAQFGVKPSSLKVLCSQRGISLRKRRLPGTTPRKRPPRMTRLPLGDEVLRSLRVAARLLDRPPAQLVSDLLEKIASDSLYMAVLDEEPA